MGGWQRTREEGRPREVQVVEVSGRSSAILVMSFLAQLVVLLRGNVLLYTPEMFSGKEIRVVSTIHCSYEEENSLD